MRLPGRRRPMWMTSGESSTWLVPRIVEIVETGCGPNPSRTYVLVRVPSPAGDSAIRQDLDGRGLDRPDPAPTDPVQGQAQTQTETQTLVIADRFDAGWNAPHPGRVRHVAVWELDRPGVSWDERALTAVDPSPQYWCTICATLDEANEIADDLRRQLRRAGW